MKSLRPSHVSLTDTEGGETSWSGLDDVNSSWHAVGLVVVLAWYNRVNETVWLPLLVVTLIVSLPPHIVLYRLLYAWYGRALEGTLGTIRFLQYYFL